MKVFLQAALCFVFVSVVFGQGYGRRRQRRPRVISSAGFDPIGSPFGHGLDSLGGDGMRGMPDHVRKIIGSTVTGEAIVGGMSSGFPRHGGTLNEDGMVNGWGADPNEAANPVVDMWSDPLNGAAFPTDYGGQDLVFDPRLNRYIVQKDSSVGHQIAKESHVAAKSGAIISGGVPSSHNTAKAEHNIVKEANHITRKTVGGVGGVLNPVGADPISHNIDKQIASGTGLIGTGSVGSFLDPLATQTGHSIAKSSGVIGADPFGVGIDPFGQISHGALNAPGRHIGISKLGTVNAGHVGIDAPRAIAHNIGKATLGTDALGGHNIAKASTSPIGVGFINPEGVVASRMHHDIAKETSVVAVDPFNTVGHNMARDGVDISHVGFGGKTSDPVHNVNKVGQSGLAGMGHDSLSASIGHGIAKHATGQAAAAIDMGSRGELSAGNPIAIAATRGLVRESLHVAGKTLDMATSGMTRGRHVGASMFGQGSGMVGRRRLGVGMDIFGQGSIIDPKPVKKPPRKFPTGYGRRRY